MNVTDAKVSVKFALEIGSLKRQLPVSALIEEAVARKEGVLTASGALQVLTGKFTGRSPKDKYIVQEQSTADKIDWGGVNRPLAPEKFDRLYRKAMDYMSERELYVFDGFAGTDGKYRLPVRFINEYAWHNLFVRQLFIRPSREELEQHRPAFTVIALPGLKAEPEVHGTNSETFIAVSFEKNVVLIGGTEYAGEMKKSIFTVLNFLLPLDGVLPMHCSANVGEKGDVALFFGLSGTGKTTLSADPQRHLIGDDEHGWSDQGVFNFEGGCYAKCIGLSREKEPQIWNAVRYGTVLENVTVDRFTREVDFDSSLYTENTRAAYPVEYIPNALIPGAAGHPNTIIFLTADAFGVLPPVAKLTKDQAMYHFLSGYTSKLAGTERGVTEPEATFSTCFGAPFLPMDPRVYAKLLGEKIERHGVRVYLVNTGWTGGPYGIGERVKLTYTRAMVTACLNGEIEQGNFTQDPVFGWQVPAAMEGVPSELFNPRIAWQDKAAYDRMAGDLALKFVNNFSRFADIDPAIRNAGPRV
jgi:phosphoenolpyruvate carboxykinase (ATP)